MSSNQEVNSAESMVDNALRRERELKDNFTDDAVKELKGEITSANQAIHSLERECGSLHEDLREVQDSLQAAARLAEQVPGLQDRLMQEHSGLQRAIHEVDQLQRELDEERENQDRTKTALDEGEEQLRLARQQLQEATRVRQEAELHHQEKQRLLEKQLTDSLSAATLASAEAENEKRRAEEAEKAGQVGREQAARDKAQLQDKISKLENEKDAAQAKLPALQKKHEELMAQHKPLLQKIKDTEGHRAILERRVVETEELVQRVTGDHDVTKASLNDTAAAHNKAKEDHQDHLKRAKMAVDQERREREEVVSTHTVTIMQIRSALEEGQNERTTLLEQHNSERSILEARLEVETSARQAAEDQIDALRDEFENELGYYQDARERAEAELTQERNAADALRRNGELRQNRAEEELFQAHDREQQLNDLLRAMEKQLENERTAQANHLDATRAKLRDHEITITTLHETQTKTIRSHEATQRAGDADQAKVEKLEKELKGEKAAGRAAQDQLRLLEAQIEELRRKMDEPASELKTARASFEAAEKKNKQSMDDLQEKQDLLQAELAFHKTLAEETKKELEHARKAREQILLELATEKQQHCLDTSRGRHSSQNSQ